MRKIFAVLALVIATVSIAGCGNGEEIEKKLKKAQSASTAVCASDTPDAKVQGAFVDALLDYQVEWEKGRGTFIDYSSNYASPAKTATDLGVKCEAASTLVSGLQLQRRLSDTK